MPEGQACRGQYSGNVRDNASICTHHTHSNVWNNVVTLKGTAKTHTTTMIVAFGQFLIKLGPSMYTNWVTPHQYLHSLNGGGDAAGQDRQKHIPRLPGWGLTTTSIPTCTKRSIPQLTEPNQPTCNRHLWLGPALDPDPDTQPRKLQHSTQPGPPAQQQPAG